MDEAAFVLTGYALTAGSLLLYVGSLLARARRAKERAAAVAARRGAAS